MLRAVRLFAAVAALATPLVPARGGEPCLLCGGQGSGQAGDTVGGDSSAGPGEARPPIDIEMTTGFNFRRFTLPGAGGEMLVEADGASIGGDGGYALVGQVVIRGAPHAHVNVVLPARITLVSRSGDRIEIMELRDDLPRDPQLDANGRLEFSFSAPLALPAGAQPGNYRASFSIDANYD